ncbi:MAG: alkaline phosphatase family protein [Actinomycetota bacterium]
MLTPFGRVVVALLVLLVAGVTFLVVRDDDPGGPSGARDDRIFGSNDPIARACDLAPKELARLWRGHDELHSEDVTTVPLPPNYSGSFGTTSHSGPWDYLQKVPLVLYGPGNIRSNGPLNDPVGIADVYPTAGRLTGVDLPPRAGRPLDAALEPDASPKVIVTVVWDGIGRNVLERWPDRWPNLKRLGSEGTSYVEAVVGSSPSITPATHATLGTGAYPRQHGMTAIEMRLSDGRVGGAFAGRDPRQLRLTTFADEIDLALDNVPVVGMLAWKSWHLGMLGHGTQTTGGDADQLGLIGDGISGNDAFYSTPEEIASFRGIKSYADELDRADGSADGQWRGHDILEQHDNPAWVGYQTDALLAMLAGQGYGSDDVPDLFFTNYKPTDIVAHQHNMDSEEMGAVLEAQDAALGDLVDHLDRRVKDYVVIVTADHGNTPPATRSDAWPLLQGRLQESIDARFDVPAGRSLVEQTTAAGPFLDRKMMRRLKVTAEDVARFLNGYTIRDNWREENLPEGYGGRGDENVLAAAYPSDRIRDVLQCAFDAPKPPEDVGV